MKIEELKEFSNGYLEKIKAAGKLEELEKLQIEILGKKGHMRRFYDQMKDVDAALRPEFGKTLNTIRGQVCAALADKKEDLSAMAGAGGDYLDITLPGRRFRTGGIHPITQTVREITKIFNSLGFSVAEGPDVELETNNFDALNIPATHPSRDMHDTFYVEDGIVLRTHTSNVQIRTMKDRKPPLRIIAPGRCYRNDTIDATHSPIFHQIEGLYVDRGVSFADLKYTLTYFAKSLYGNDMKVRFRPSYFPFTEPSAEYDFSCMFCSSKGCKVCKGTGWIEISGAGMVSPAVFDNVGYDNEEFTGFAFGMGVERIAMLRFGIDDIRHFYDNELPFLEQF